MNYDKLEKCISSPRINRYLLTCKYSKKSASKLYVLNLKLSQSFYPLLNLFETALRNSIHEEIKRHFNDHDWVINQKNGFMSDGRLGFTNYYLKQCVIKAEAKIQANKKNITTSRIIAEQTFGFWTSFFDKHHYKLINGCALNVFRNKPKNINRADISKELNVIRDLRNRIYHNEPICFNLNEVSLVNINLLRNNILMLIEWIDPDFLAIFNKFLDVDSHIMDCEDFKQRIK